MDQKFKDEIRIVLVGKAAVGKSSSGNTILGKEVFHKESGSRSVTRHCQKASENIGDKEITVVDTPGWCDTDLSEKELTEETAQCIDMSQPGPHVFLLVLTIGRFTKEEKETVQKLQEIFGQDAIKYTMILFTRGDNLEDKSIDEYVRDAAEDLKAIVDMCEGRYHVFNNKDKSCDQVSTFLQKIQDMVRNNNGQYFSNTTSKMLENHIKRKADLQQQMQAAEKQKENKMAEPQLHKKVFDQDIPHQELEAENHEMSCAPIELKEQTPKHCLKKEKLMSESEEQNNRMEIHKFQLENQKLQLENQKLLEHQKWQLENQKLQLENQKLQLENQKLQLENKKLLENQKLQLDFQKLQLENQKLFENQKLQLEIQTKQQQQQQQQRSSCIIL